MAKELKRIPATRSERKAKRLPSARGAALSREGIRKAAGSWKDVDAEALKTYIYERRRASSRPPVAL